MNFYDAFIGFENGETIKIKENNWQITKVKGRIYINTDIDRQEYALEETIFSYDDILSDNWEFVKVIEYFNYNKATEKVFINKNKVKRKEWASICAIEAIDGVVSMGKLTACDYLADDWHVVEGEVS